MLISVFRSLFFARCVHPFALLVTYISTFGEKSGICLVYSPFFRKFAIGMLRLTKLITRTLSLRISLWVVLAIATLLTAALLVMLRFSRKALKEEAVQKADQMLEATVQQIDNILLSVEQSAGIFYWDLLPHLQQPERMFKYSRKLVEANPYIAGCAIAMEPDFYQGYGQDFMAYFHRTSQEGLEPEQSSIAQDEDFGTTPYTEQEWYTMPMETGRPCWIGPLKDDETEGEAIITFSLPIYNMDRRPVGVLAVDVALTLLSRLVLAAKPSPNSYATLLGSDGSYIVHPDSSKLLHGTALTEVVKENDSSVREIAVAMLAGETGYRQMREDGMDYFVFYKPFKRSDVPGRVAQELDWSIGMVYPEGDILGDYNQLLHLVLFIAIGGLLLLLVLCEVITHRQLLPLRMLTTSAQRIAEGHYDEPIPDSRQHDEVGRLQYHFQQMQQALAAHVDEMERQTKALHEQGEVLGKAYEQAKEADRVKTAFLHHMTNQMIAPVRAIATQVDRLHEHAQQMEQGEADQLVKDLLKQSETTTELLNDLLNVSQERMEKSKNESI